MTDDELRERLDELERRVSRLEQDQPESDEIPSGEKQRGVDHRDAEIMNRMQQGKKYTSTQIQNAYKTYTDIQQDKTAKQRAKMLVKRDCFSKDGRYYVFGGK